MREIGARAHPRAMTSFDSQPRPRPLHGVRVLDLTSVVLGPPATQILGDFGAEIVRAESARSDLRRTEGVSRRAVRGASIVIARSKLGGLPSRTMRIMRKA